MSAAEPESTNGADGNGLPRHMAVIMDGNRRWARQFGMPAAMGHAAGARKVRSVVQACADRSIPYLTLFAFSTENWRRPADEVSGLLGLLAIYLQKEVNDMHTTGVRLRMIGDRSPFDTRLRTLIDQAEALTACNQRVNLTIALNYGGRQDMLQAVQAWQRAHPGESVERLTEDALRPHLSLPGIPEPDLLIRTGGESRISNFMLWQMAYTELHFTDVLWPSFGVAHLDKALDWYNARDRRFGSSGPERNSPHPEQHLA
jgi:undecaprenyl diphosphate synthase